MGGAARRWPLRVVGGGGCDLSNYVVSICGDDDVGPARRPFWASACPSRDAADAQPPRAEGDGWVDETVGAGDPGNASLMVIDKALWPGEVRKGFAREQICLS